MLSSKPFAGTVGVMAGVPSVPEPFAWSYARMVEFNAEYLADLGRIKYVRTLISDHAPARNQLVERMEGEWLLMLDTDLEFEPDLLLRMLDRMVRMDLPVLTGVYRYRQPPHSPVLYLWDSAGERFRPIAKMPAAPVFKVAGAGGGCLLVRRPVYQNVWHELGEKPFDRLMNNSEDLSFFLRLLRLGVPAWCDQRITAGHLRTLPVTAADQPEGLEDPEGFATPAVWVR